MDRTVYNTSIVLSMFVLKTHFLLARSTDFSRQLKPFIQRPSKLKVSMCVWGRRGTEPFNLNIINVRGIKRLQAPTNLH
jgi:hypothetical protein